MQGVFFRATAKKIAEENDIKGWIRNTKDGRVEAIITGDSTSTEAFISWSKSGPQDALVKDVIVTQQGFVEFNQFEIVH